MNTRLNLLPALVAATALFCFWGMGTARAQAQYESGRVAGLENRVATLEHQFPSHTTEGAACFICGAFCALWAQNTGRNAWLWFFLGLFFNVITVLVLLRKNSNDRRTQRG